MSKYIVVDESDFVSRSWVSSKPFVYNDLKDAITACNTSQCVLKVDIIQHSKSVVINEDK